LRLDRLVTIGGAPMPICISGGPHASLLWIGDDDAATGAITMLVPAYRMIERTACAWGFDPDRPPQLSKVYRDVLGRGRK
jgi:glutamine---fructose-6-phosphate transaminase (isomerizing)